MIRTTLTFATAATLFTAAACAQAPCGLLTPDQIKTVLGSPVQPGHPGGTKDSPDCTWQDAQGHDRVYLSLKETTEFHQLRAQMQSTGRMVPITGVGEDAFFISSTGSDAALYTIKRGHLVLLTVSAPNASRVDNEASEKAIATRILAKL
jgi:hypothetical protein